MPQHESRNPDDSSSIARDADVVRAESATSAEGAESERPLVPADDRPVEKGPDYVQQARDAIAAGQLQSASTQLRALIAREPRNAPARAALAELLEKRGDLDGALGELARALEIAPDDVGILCARATLFTARGRYDQAELDLRRAALADRDSADVLIQLGVLFCKRARWREGIEPLRAAVERDPQRASAHYYLGEAYNHIDDLSAALTSYEMAASLEPGHARALKGIGVVLDRLARPAEAAAAYQRARDAQRR